MKILGVILLLIGCGTYHPNNKYQKRKVIKKANSTTGCSVDQLASGAVVTCPDGSSAVIYNGSNGSDSDTAGPSGSDGTDGASCAVEQTDGGVIIYCGDSQAELYHGKDGEVGPVGPKGESGEDSVIIIKEEVEEDDEEEEEEEFCPPKNKKKKTKK